MNNPQSIAAILTTSRVIAIVGLSPKTHRDSYGVAAYLQKQGYRIVPVNPSHGGKIILDEICHASLEEAAAAMEREHQRIDIVDCFRKSEEIMPIAESAVTIHARCLWMQLDIENDEAAEKARAAGLQVIMNKCIKIEHAKIVR
jgi:predicted CoA-binding protein